MGTAFTEPFPLLTWNRCFRTTLTSLGNHKPMWRSCDLGQVVIICDYRVKEKMVGLKEKIATMYPGYDFDEFQDVVNLVTKAMLPKTIFTLTGPGFARFHDKTRCKYWAASESKYTNLKKTSILCRYRFLRVSLILPRLITLCATFVFSPLATCSWMQTFFRPSSTEASQ